MRLNFALLYEPMQKSAGTAGTTGTASNHAALTVPACPKMQGTRGNMRPPPIIEKGDARPDLFPPFPNRSHPWEHGKPSIHAGVPAVPIVPAKNHINENDREAFGERLALSPAGSIKADASRWWRVCYCDRPPLPILYQSGAGRAEVLAAFPDALEAHPFTPCIQRPSSPLSGEEETLLRRWLAQDGETDPAIIADTIDQCQRDANARRRALEMAEDELEAFEERAAIMEFDGGLTRAEAERLAGRYPTAPAC